MLPPDRVLHGIASQQHYLDRIEQGSFGGTTGTCSCRWTMSAGGKSSVIAAHRAHVSDEATRLAHIRGKWEIEPLPRGTVLISERADLPFVWNGEGRPCSVLHPDRPYPVKGEVEDLLPAIAVWVPRENEES